jgi:hypothetical protein
MFRLSRCYRWVSLGIVLVVCTNQAAYWILSARDSSRVTQANAQRIELDMSPAEVEAILGRPHRVSRLAQPHCVWTTFDYFNGKSELREDNQLTIEVTFRDGRVCNKRVGDGHKPTLLERAKRWVRNKSAAIGRSALASPRSTRKRIGEK